MCQVHVPLGTNCAFPTAQNQSSSDHAHKETYLEILAQL